LIPTIRFSSDYTKLPTSWEGTQATLLAVVPVSITEIKKRYPAFIKYDTKYRGKEGYYPLNFEQGIILLFLHHNTGKVFSTIRRNFPKKRIYYKSKVLSTFILAKPKEEG